MLQLSVKYLVIVIISSRTSDWLLAPQATYIWPNCFTHPGQILYRPTLIFSQRQAYEHLSLGHRYWWDVYRCGVRERTDGRGADCQGAEYTGRSLRWWLMLDSGDLHTLYRT